MAFTFIQLLVDVILVAGLLLVLLGRGWRRGAAASADPGESREFLASLTALIREMQDTADRLEQRLDAKRGEVERAIALADDRIGKLDAAAMRAGPGGAAGGTGEAPASEPAASRPAPRRAAAPEPEAGGAGDELDDDARADRYRQVVDFARKGWDAAEIAKQTRLPRGEVDLLLKTRGRER